MPIIIDIREDLRFKQGRAEGKIEGKIEGKAEGLFHTAETMLREGVPAPLVSKYTGLPLAEIKKKPEEFPIINSTNNS